MADRLQVIHPGYPYEGRSYARTLDFTGYHDWLPSPYYTGYTVPRVYSLDVIWVIAILRVFSVFTCMPMFQDGRTYEYILESSC